MNQIDATVFTLEQFNRAIEGMAKAQERAVKSVGGCIVMALYFANKENDAGAANALMRTLRKSTKKDAIVALLSEKGNLAYVSGSFVAFDAGRNWNVDEVAAIKVAAAAWETYKKAETEPDALDMVDEVCKLLAKASKRIKADKDGVIHAEMIEELTALVGKIAGKATIDA